MELEGGSIEKVTRNEFGYNSIHQKCCRPRKIIEVILGHTCTVRVLCCSKTLRDFSDSSSAVGNILSEIRSKHERVVKFQQCDRRHPPAAEEFASY